MNDPIDKVAMGTMGVQGFTTKTEQVWQLKWFPMIGLVLNWQLTSLACEVSHNNSF